MSKFTRLTDNDQAAIFSAFARTTGTNNVSPLLAAVHDIVEAHMANAWDEANQTAHDCGWLTDRDVAEMNGRNPYRATEETP